MEDSGLYADSDASVCCLDVGNNFEALIEQEQLHAH